MPRTSTQTPVTDEWTARFLLAPDDGTSPTRDERLHLQFTVTYTDDLAEQSRAETVTYKLDSAGPYLPGAQLISDVKRPDGTTDAPSKFAPGQVTALLQLVNQAYDVAVETLDLD